MKLYWNVSNEIVGEELERHFTKVVLMKQLSRTRTYAERKITNSKRGQSRLEWLTAIEPVEDHHTGKRHHGLVLLWSLSDKRPREISVGNHWPV